MPFELSPVKFPTRFTASESSSVIGAYEDTCESLEINHPILVDFSLRQNYPNPFNPNTQIDFVVPKTANVQLQIYNIFL